MDTHRQTYFSSNSVQLDIDTSPIHKRHGIGQFFCREKNAVSRNGHRAHSGQQLARYRALVYPDVFPGFSSLFVEPLPTVYFQREWDIFLSEGVQPVRAANSHTNTNSGVVFLFRIEPHVTSMSTHLRLFPLVYRYTRLSFLLVDMTHSAYSTC
jgi:hypothetical protein